MLRSKMKSCLFAMAICAATGITTGAYASCQELVAAFDDAVAARSVDAARRALAAIGDDVVCGGRLDEFREKLVNFLVNFASTAGVTNSDRERAIALAQRTLEISRSWQGAETLADYFLSHGDKPDAYHWYDLSASFLKTNPSSAATPVERRKLLTKLTAAQSLTNDDHEGKISKPYMPAMRDFDGNPSSIASDVFLRGAMVVNVPIPINFYTNETRFTPNGEKAMQELADAVRAAQVRAMKLVGHADPRGPAQHNMDLSRRRVEAVRDRLLQQIKVAISIEWKGAEQQFDASVLPYRPSQEEIWQLDRRVEWVRNGLPQ